MFSTLSNRWGTLASDPFEAVRREFDRDPGFRGEGLRQDVPRYGALSLREDDERVYIEMDVPGMSIDDLDLTLEKGQLWISGERKLPQNAQGFWYDERYHGAFRRVVSLGDSIDPGSIDATLHDGVLSVTLTKKPEHQPHRVQVRYDGGQNQKRLSESGSSK